MFLGFAGMALLTACQTTPEDKDFARAYAYFLAQSQREIAVLDEKKAQGQISKEEYDAERARLEDGVVRKANDRILTEHQLNESYRESMGLPTPRSAPRTIDIPSGPIGPRTTPAAASGRPGF